MGIEELDELGEIGERAGETVDLVDDHHVDPLRPDLRNETLQRRTLQ